VDGAFGTTTIRSSEDYINEKGNLPKMPVAWVNDYSVLKKVMPPLSAPDRIML
jgi:hypothetical protein